MDKPECFQTKPSYQEQAENDCVNCAWKKWCLEVTK